MAALVVTIKTVGEDLSALDQVTKAHLCKQTPVSDELLSSIASSLSLSPLTGRIVALAVYDTERSEGAVYYTGDEQLPNERLGACVYKVRDEAALLAEFWEGLTHYDTIVTFNGRSFVLPFLIHRSVIHNIRPTVDLLRYRYLAQQLPPYHVDLFDQLTFNGVMRQHTSLYLFCRAYGIPSLQLQGCDGSQTETLYKAKQYHEIAVTAGADVLAIALLYEKWRTFLAPPLFQKPEKEIDL
ncbi:MAG: hypothetical protein RLZZ70_837 [Candidatus Parcubacteria bacterium]